MLINILIYPVLIGTVWLKSTLHFGSKREFIPKVTLIQNVMKPLRYALTFVLLSLLTSLYSQEQLVNRRVMLVNFTNLQNKADFEYLAISIPEAMLIALDDTKNFDLLQVSTWDKLVESGKYAKSDTKKDARVQAAGLSQGADVVVLGSFANIGQDLKITARAIEVKSGRLIVTKSVLAKTDGSMFGSIDNLSVDIAGEMKNKLPPLPPREVIREKIVQTPGQPTARILSVRFIRLGVGRSFSSSSFHDAGFNLITLDFLSPYPKLKLPLYARLTYRYIVPYSVTVYSQYDTAFSASILSFDLGFSIPYRISNRWFVAADIGARLSSYSETSDVQFGNLVGSKLENTTFTIGPAFTISLEYLLSKNIGLYLAGMYSYEPIGSSSPYTNIGGMGGMAGVSFRK